MVLDYCRWVMVKKRDESPPAPGAVVPDLPEAVPVSELIVPAGAVFAHTTRSRPAAPPVGRLRAWARRSTTSTA